MDATSRGAERIDRPTRAGYKDAPSHHRGSAVGTDKNIAGVTKGPLQFEARYLLSRQPGIGGILKTRVGSIHSPAVPAWTRQRFAEVARSRGTHGGGSQRRSFEFRSELLLRHKLGDRVAPRHWPARRHVDHFSRFHRVKNPFRRHGLQRLALRSAL